MCAAGFGQVPKGLVGCWNFDEGKGTVSRDESGNNNTASIHGAEWVKIKKGYALKFDGNDDYVQCGRGAVLDIVGPVTVEAWIHPLAVPPAEGEAGIVGKSFNSYLLSYYGGAPYCWWYIGHGSNYCNMWLELGSWQHVVGTFDGDSMKLYVDGKLAGSRTSKFKTMAREKDFFIGRAAEPEAAEPDYPKVKHFEGMLDAVRVYSRVLSESDVKLHYVEEAPNYGIAELAAGKKAGAPAGAEEATRMAEEKPPFIMPPGQRQLFLDDYGIAKVENLTRTMHQPKKKGAVIRPAADDPETTSIQTRTAPVWNPRRKVWQLWDCSTPDDLHAKKLYCSGYYESKDGLHWTKPVVGQFERDGSLENNYIAIRTGRGWGRPGRVVYDPTDPDPSRRYKLPLPNTGVAVSPDGINWKMLLDVPGVPSSDECNFSFDKESHLFILTVKHNGPYGRAVFLSTSKDFEHWTKPELIFHADKRDQELGRENIKARMGDPTLQQTRYNEPARYKVDVYNMGVFRYEGLYIGTPAMFHVTGPLPNYPNSDGFHLVQLACSRDLKTWKRLGGRKPFIGPSRRDSGAYDLTQIIGPSNAIVRGDELWFYYTGIKYRAAGSDFVGKYPTGKFVPRHGFDTDRGAICLAVLRRDGFISLDADEKPGTVLTKPFELPGGKLFVNVDAHKGELRVEALDKEGKALAASAPMNGDLLRGEVTWQQGDISDLKGQEVSLRFSLRNAGLYSYWLKD